MRDRHPQHLGMVALGFATGWRPSMMRPLRRGGPSADVLWDKNVVLARRLQTRGEEVREATKNSTRFRITLPPDAMAVLRWHADRLPAGPMQESDLLFPSETGGFRSPTVLDKPFKDICQHLCLGKKVTPKAMRRTFQDLARRAAVDGLVQRSICGHLTEAMTERYSSVISSVRWPQMLRWTRPSTAARRARSWKVRRIAFGVTFLPRQRCLHMSLNGLSRTVGLRKPPGSEGTGDRCPASDPRAADRRASGGRPSPRPAG